MRNAASIWLSVSAEMNIPTAMQVAPQSSRPPKPSSTVLHSSAVPDSLEPKSERMSGKMMVSPSVAQMTPSAAQVLAQHDLHGPHRRRHQQLEGLVALLLGEQPHGEERRDEEGDDQRSRPRAGRRRRR